MSTNRSGSAPVLNNLHMGYRMNIDDLRNIKIDNKNVAVVVIGGLLLAGTVILYFKLFSSAAAPVAPLPARPAQITGLPSQPTALKGYAQGETMRDPFALPPELQQATPAMPRSLGSGGGSSGYTAPVHESSPMLPQLNGVVSAGATRMAVLQYGAESRSYRVHERIGPYELTAVSDNSVTLLGPSGKIVLAVGR